jgi:cytochrome oxidase Cu insertion factor (SCO1/SenC/PrrC family)
LILVALVFAAPLVGAYFAYHYWRPSATMNYGELIPPTPLAAARLTLVDGKPFSLSAHQGKWLLVAVDAGGCETACRGKLYLMRQIRLALGKHQDRVERVWLIDDTAPLAADLEKEYAGTWFVRAQGAELLKQLKSEQSPREHFYLIDPIGNLMMRYAREPDARRMLKDLDRLMKVSQVG